MTSLFELAKTRREDRFSQICLNKRRKQGLYRAKGLERWSFRKTKEKSVSFTPDNALGQSDFWASVEAGGWLSGDHNFLKAIVFLLQNKLINPVIPESPIRLNKKTAVKKINFFSSVSALGSRSKGNHVLTEYLQ